MRFWLAWLAVMLPLSASSPVRQTPRNSLGFEKSGSAYVAQSFGSAIQVDGAGAAIYSPSASFHIRLRHSNPRATLAGLGNAGTRNRFIGSQPSQWRTGIHLFERVEVRQVYPGVDVAWYGTGNRLEYDFIIAPGADPERIALETSGDRLIQQQPVAYQTLRGKRRQVPCRFVLARDGALHFALGGYDHTAALTIDPVILYSGYLPGTGAAGGNAVTVDSSGNFYLAGFTYSTTNGNSNVLLLKVPPSGSPVQSLFGGTTGQDTANAITVDSSGNVYLAGSTSSSNFPIAGSVSVQAQEVGLLKAFVLSLNAANTRLNFSAFFGGSYSDDAYGLALGSNGYLYVVGDTNSPDFLASSLEGELICPTGSALAFQCANHGGYDGFLVVLSTRGTFGYATYIGGSGDDHAFAVAVDSSGNAYVTGMTASVDFPVCPGGVKDPNLVCPLSGSAFQTALKGTANAFAIEIYQEIQSGTGTIGSLGAWSTFIGGESADAANAIVLDSSNNLYLAGTTNSTAFPVSGGYQTTYQGGTSDGFVFALSNNGLAGLWSTYLGSPGADVLTGIAMDSGSNLYVTGATDGTAFPVTADAVQATNAGGQDAIISKLSNNGKSLLFSTYFGGSGNDVSRGVAVDAFGDIYFGGITTSINNDLPIVTGSPGVQATYGGGASDAFLSVIGCASATPVINAGGVANAASFSANALSPGAVIAIFGTNFSCSAAAASAIPLTTALGGVTVSVNGVAIPLFYVSANQINAQLPYETAVGSASVTVTGPGGASAAATFAVETAAPGIFVVNGQAAARNQDGTLNTASNPAKPGSVISVYFTGQGPVRPAVATGAAAPSSPLSYVASTDSATIGGENATIYSHFMGLAPGLVGLAQVNLVVPSVGAGSQPVVVTIDGVSSAPATIAVSN